MTITDIISQARYKEGGREWPHVDCYGIVLFYRALIGLPELPELGHARRGVNMDGIGRAQAGQMRKCEPKQGAVVACYNHAGMMEHTAVMIDQRTALEINSAGNARTCTIDKMKRRFKTVEFYE